MGYKVAAADAETTNSAWCAAIDSAVPLTDDILQRYEEVQRKVVRERVADETRPVPAPSLLARQLISFGYADSLILFRRLEENTYELRAHPWDSDTARACVEASRACGLLFRVGQTNTTRLAGLIQ